MICWPPVGKAQPGSTPWSMVKAAWRLRRSNAVCSSLAVAGGCSTTASPPTAADCAAAGLPSSSLLEAALTGTRDSCCCSAWADSSASLMIAWAT